MMDPGRRDRWVTINQRTLTRQPSGAPKEEWTALVSCWMSREDIMARERYAGQASTESTPLTTRWTMAYRADMDPELVAVGSDRQLVEAGRAYDITGARHLERRLELEFTTLARIG